MRHSVAKAFAMGLVCVGVCASFAVKPARAAADDQAVLQADHNLLQAIGKADQAAAGKLLDAELIWTDSQGKSETKADVLQSFPAIGNADVEAKARIYGHAGVVYADRGRLQVLRVWAKRPAGWRLLLYQEVMLAEKPRPVPNANVNGGPCENPCKTIPYQPKSENEKAALAGMQAVQVAIATGNTDAWAAATTEDFTATNSPDNEVYDRANRIAQLTSLAKSGRTSTPTPMVSAQVFDMTDAVLIVAHEQPPTNKTNLNTRLMVNQNGRWLMLFSFNTRIEASEAPKRP
jgi:hypothetical protein